MSIIRPIITPHLYYNFDILLVLKNVDYITRFLNMNYEQAVSYFEKLHNISATEIITDALYNSFLVAFAVFLMLFLFAFLSLFILFITNIIKDRRHIGLDNDIEVGFNTPYIKSFFGVCTKDSSDLIKVFCFAVSVCFIVIFAISLIKNSFDLPISKRDIINSPYYQTLNTTQKEYIKYHYFILNDEPDDSKVIIKLDDFKNTIKAIEKLKGK